MWVALQWGVGGVLKLCSIIFVVWALEAVPWVPMMNEQRCSVVIWGVCLGEVTCNACAQIFELGEIWPTPPFSLLTGPAPVPCSPGVCFHAQVRSWQAQAASRAHPYSPSAIPFFPTVLSPASKSTGFSLPLCIPFVSSGKLIKSSSVLHTRERREWEGTCFSLSVDPSLAVGPRQSCILAQALFPPLNSCMTWKEGFLKSFGAIKFTGYNSCVFCREIRPLTHPVSPTSGTWW